MKYIYEIYEHAFQIKISEEDGEDKHSYLMYKKVL